MMTSLVRIIQSGVQIFRRNAALFAATIAIMSMMLVVLGGLYVFRFFTARAVEVIQDRIALNIYFDSTVDESGILRARDLLAQLPEVERVDYVSREEAIARFRERHKNNAALVQALEEIGSNPFQAMLRVKAEDAQQYAAIASFIEKAPFRNQIAKFGPPVDNQLVIERLNRMIAAIRNVGVALSVALAAIAVLVFFNTMRIAIYTFREEIAIMKLVGASNNFVRGPFAVAGLLAGAIAAMVSFVLFIVAMQASSAKIEALIPGIGITGFLAANWWQVFAIQLAFGMGLGMFTSFLAINKHLKV